MDAGLAKTLNSSVGTSTLKSLDTILKTDNTTIANNAADRLFNSLKNSSKLVGSDDVLFAYSGGWTFTNGDSDTDFGRNYDYYKTNSFIQIGSSGAVTFKTTQLGMDATNGTMPVQLRVYDSSGATVGNIVTEIPQGVSAEVSVSVNVTANAKYKVAIAFYNGGNAHTNLTVCGKTIILAPTVTMTS